MIRKKTKPINDNKYYELLKSKIQGYGAFAIKNIRKGTKIVEYLGEIITEEEADIRYEDVNSKRHHTFLFAVNETKCIDGAYNGNSAVFINHSCNPNCEPVTIGDRIFIYALRNIKIGEELLYDYGYEKFSYHTKEDELLYKCLCGSENCRGTILKDYKKKKQKQTNVIYAK